MTFQPFGTSPAHQRLGDSLAAPAQVGQGVCTPSTANLDLNDKLVKRGVLVSWHGLRGEVQRVRMGRCLVRLPNGGVTGGVRIPGELADKWLACSTVQVVS